MSRSGVLGAALIALVYPVSALADYDGDFYVITPQSTGMMGEWVYDVFYDDATGKTWIAADDPVWDEGGIASTFDGLTWDTYSNVNDEIPTHVAQELRKGPDGMLYMASDVGLLRFNGTEVETVWSKANAPVWPVTGVTDFDWDSKGNLWVALSEVNTVLGGVAKYDGVKWTLYNSANGAIPWTKPWDSVVTLDVDSTDRVWVGSNVVGAAMYDGVKWTWFEPKFGQLPSNWVNEILVEDDGTAWFGTMSGGIARLVGTKWKTWDQTVEGTLNTNDIANLALDRDGDVWLTTFIGGAWEFTGTTWDQNNYPLGHVYGLTFDDQNRPILGGIGGMVFSDGQVYSPFAVSLSNRWLDASLGASDGTMWFGGGGGGVTQFDGTTWKSWNPYNWDVYEWPFATDAVEDIVERDDGHIFVNAINHGVGEWDGVDWIEHIGTQSIEVMDFAPDGTLWAGPYNGAELVTYNGAVWKQVNWPYTAYSGDIYSMAVDPLGDVWVGTIVGLYHSADAGLTWTLYNDVNSPLPHMNVFALAAEPDGSGVWIGTEGGLAFFDGGSSWTTYTMANSGIPADSVDVLEIAPDGALWVGAFDGSNWPYDGGVARFDGVTWRTWTEENSNIPHEQIYSIAFDADSNAWVGTASEGIGVLYVEGDGAETFLSSPIDWRVNKGSWLIGQTLQLFLHDDDPIWVETVLKGSNYNVSSTVDLQTHVADPSSLTIDSVVFSDGLMSVSYAVKNVVTGAWDPVGAPQKVGNADVEASLVVPSPADHIDASGLVQLRITGKGSVAKNPFGFPSIAMDYVEMTVRE